jgi:hypothetical protein
MAKITPNDLLNPTEKTIKNWNCSFIAVEGPNILDKLSLEDLAIPYESQYRSRIILAADEVNQPLLYGFLGKATTFLMVKVTYDSINDPYYQYEQEKYNITYYFENDPTPRPLGRLMVMTGSADMKIPQIYLSNPLSYDVTLDVLHATVDTNYNDDAPVAEFDDSLRFIYSQANNDFVPGIVISNSGGTWVKADSSSETKLGYIIVESIIDSSRFSAVQAGLITVPTWNLIPGAYYMLDDSGNGTIVEYNDNLTFTFSNPVLQAISSTQGHVLPWRPSYQGNVSSILSTSPIKLTGVTLDVSGWTLVSGYYEYVYINTNITSKSIITLLPYNDSMSVYLASGILPRIVTSSNSATISAILSPTDDILVDIVITDSK